MGAEREAGVCREGEAENIKYLIIDGRPSTQNKAIYAIMAMKGLGIEGPRHTVHDGHYENPYYVQGGSVGASRCAGGLWRSCQDEQGGQGGARTTTHSEPCDGPLVREPNEQSWGRIREWRCAGGADARRQGVNAG